MTQTDPAPIAVPDDDNERILGPFDLSTERRVVRREIGPGRVIYLRSLSPVELAEWDAEVLDASGRYDRGRQKYQAAKLVARVWCNPKGERFFADGDWGKLAEDQSGTVRLIHREASRFLGLFAGDEESEKN